jgi:alginate O-acetyltransferase complex protein AlgI
MGGARRYGNLLLAMLLGGLWHGASWTFVIWGGVHGAFRVINHLWGRTGIQLPGPIAWAIRFGIVMIGWVFFRAPSLRRAQVILAGMAGLNGLDWSELLYSIGGNRLRLILPLAVLWWGPTRTMGWRWRSDYVYALAFAILLGVSILRFGNPSPFVYVLF